jgi:hypothetical protein
MKKKLHDYLIFKICVYFLQQRFSNKLILPTYMHNKKP